MEDSDLFISYSSRNRPFVEGLTRDLTKHGVRVWWDHGEMKIGDSLNAKIQEGIRSSRWLAIVLSPEAVASPWVERELNAGLIYELEQRQVFVLPLLHQPCSIPMFLRDKIYADFSKSYARGLRELLDRVAPMVDPELVACLMSDDESKILSSDSRISRERRAYYHRLLLDALATSARPDERLAAMTALFVVRYSGLAAHLLELVQTGQPALRRRALFCLGEMRTQAALQVVVCCLSDPNPDVRAEARSAYRKLST